MKMTILAVPPVLEGIIEGEPLSKQRPRFSGGHAYTPAETRRAQEALAWKVKSFYRGDIDKENQFAVHLSFFLETGQRRDLDNMCKLVMDACTGLIWEDDSQVSEIFAKQSRFEKEPRTEILISRLGPLKRLTSICVHCGKEYPTYQCHRKNGRNFCTAKCRAEATYISVTVQCAECGAAIKHQKRYVEKNKTGVFWCSPACRSARGARRIR